MLDNSNERCAVTLAQDMACALSKQRSIWINSRHSCIVNSKYGKSFAIQSAERGRNKNIYAATLTQSGLCLDGGITLIQENKLMSNSRKPTHNLQFKCSCCGKLRHCFRARFFYILTGSAASTWVPYLFTFPKNT